MQENEEAESLTTAEAISYIESYTWSATRLGRSPLFILDGGHNPQCAQAMAGSIGELLPGQGGLGVALSGGGLQIPEVGADTAQALHTGFLVQHIEHLFLQD